MRHQSNEIMNRISRTGLHCVWTRSDRISRAPLTARWVLDQPQTPNRDRGSDRKRKDEDTPCGINLQFV